MNYILTLLHEARQKVREGLVGTKWRSMTERHVTWTILEFNPNGTVTLQSRGYWGREQTRAIPSEYLGVSYKPAD